MYVGRVEYGEARPVFLEFPVRWDLIRKIKSESKGLHCSARHANNRSACIEPLSMSHLLSHTTTHPVPMLLIGPLHRCRVDEVERPGKRNQEKYLPPPKSLSPHITRYRRGQEKK
jgi:hypothetical protein